MELSGRPDMGICARGSGEVSGGAFEDEGDDDAVEAEGEDGDAKVEPDCHSAEDGVGEEEYDEEDGCQQQEHHQDCPEAVVAAQHGRLGDAVDGGDEYPDAYDDDEGGGKCGVGQGEQPDCADEFEQAVSKCPAPVGEAHGAECQDGVEDTGDGDADGECYGKGGDGGDGGCQYPDAEADADKSGDEREPPQ